MKKVEKIWLGIFFAMFVLPEIFWSPVISFGYELLQNGNTHPLRYNYLTNLEHKNSLILVLVIETIGSLACSVLLMKTTVNKGFYFRFLQTVVFTFFLASLLVLYFSLAFNQGISF